MATIINTLIDGYQLLNYDLSDPRMKDWFLTSSPVFIIAIMLIYIHFVKTLGPYLMENREPFDLKRVMQLYDVIQIAVNGYLVYKALVLGWMWQYSLFCQAIDYSDTPHSMEIASGIWLYFIVKLIDLLDTVFFVLRKKQNQITFLHMYHHTAMVAGAWVGLKYVAGGHITFLGLINSFVHMVMYTYYLIASMNLGKLWWKKYITQLQLTQFLAILLHNSALFFIENCDFPKWPAFIVIPQNIFMISMFADFYYHEYIKKDKARKSVQNGNLNETAKTK